MFSLYSSYYPIVIVLQAICVIHCLARQNESKWLWIIVIVPLIGSIAYLYTQFFSNKKAPEISALGNVLYPQGKIKKLEKNLHFADTFNNRVALADAYLANSEVDKAIDLYKASLTGAFAENEYVINKLILAYQYQKKYEAIVPLAKRIYKLPQFARSPQHIAYALALEHTGNVQQAEEEFKTMKAPYAHFEARYQYGLFLVRAQRQSEAKTIFNTILSDAAHLGSHEKRSNRHIFSLTKDELKKIG